MEKDAISSHRSTPDWSDKKLQSQVRVHTTEPASPNGQTPQEKASFKDRVWLWELFAWVLCASGLAAIAIILAVTDGKPMPRWTATSRYTSTKLTVTINSVISIFSTLVKSTLLIPVVAALQQLKWIWFGEERPLSHIKKFEGAGKGPLGSAILIWTLRGRRLACLGAFITVAALGVDFTLQQLVTYPLKPSPAGFGTVARSNSYTGWRDGAITSMKSPELAMLSAIYRGMYDYNGTELFYPTPNCPSGNCTWPELYTSLGVCSRCTDVTPLLTLNCSTAPYITYSSDDSGNLIPNTVGNPISYCNYTLPGGQALSGLPEFSSAIVLQLNNSAAGESGSNVTWFSRDLHSHLTAFTVIRATPESQNDTAPDGSTRFWNTYTAVNATECGLDLCVKRYRGSMKNAIFSETVVDTFVNDTATTANSGYNSETYPPSSWTNSSTAHGNNAFTVDFSTWSGLYLAFASDHGNMFQGTATVGGSTTRADTDIASYMNSLDQNATVAMVDSMAAAMTKRIREASGSEALGLGPTAQGILYQNIPFVQVRWGWISYSAVLVAITLVFLILTMVQNALGEDSILWKADPLANFYYPLTRDGRDALQNARTAEQAEAVADSMKVKWTKTEAGYRMVPQQDHGA